jgi:hypothetical protein
MKRIARWFESFLDWLDRPTPIKEELEETHQEWLERQW